MSKKPLGEFEKNSDINVEDPQKASQPNMSFSKANLSVPLPDTHMSKSTTFVFSPSLHSRSVQRSTASLPLMPSFKDKKQIAIEKQRELDIFLHCNAWMKKYEQKVREQVDKHMKRKKGPTQDAALFKGLKELERRYYELLTEFVADAMVNFLLILMFLKNKYRSVLI
ncbi:MAG: hypothetical protein K2Q14_07380 [Gammaproteobacteria bacterium]|nr:hypothetical protein [Gammaproteobacteria bacterium]